eukprot:CAMPEP_0119304486 /NCGR_PEP_ID=MMETSP1333-20130426/5701_1 /TAXON_ID=418940 /ORGANISM="Scyphosphaera apsteinii, Strain RCC1455" /LENGTH=674 /DNA_ID=CAMNT_0007307385 /DNA_START=37 /DNA_END=2061 /DNA_ORIENTATION=-
MRTMFGRELLLASLAASAAAHANRSNERQRNGTSSCARLTTAIERASFSSEGNTGAARPPNVVLMLGDDVGYGDISAYGHPYSSTPSLDRLAREGTAFKQFYVSGCTCAPSRAGWMTARNPATFVYSRGLGNMTLTERLSFRGYAVGHFGKWHIGPEHPIYVQRHTGAPVYGIDLVVHSNQDLDCFADNHKDYGRGYGRDELIYSAAIKWIRKVHRAHHFYANVWGHSTHDPVFNCKYRDYMSKLAASSPFQQLVVNHSRFGAHMRSRLDVASQLGISTSMAMRRYLEDLHALDYNIGRLLHTLDRLDLIGSTIVTFSSDHGPAVTSTLTRTEGGGFAGESPFLMGYAGGLRGGKFTHYEGGVRVPFIIRWPGVVPAARTDSLSVFSSLDWLPTILDITRPPTSANFDHSPTSDTHINKTPKTETRQLDGESINDVLRGATRDRSLSHPLMWKGHRMSETSGKSSGHRDDNIVSMRQGDWKLHMIPARVARTGNWEHVAMAHAQKASGKSQLHEGSNLIELYRLSDDPGERYNVAVDHQNVVKGMLLQANQWNQSLHESQLVLSIALGTTSMQVGARSIDGRRLADVADNSSNSHGGTPQMNPKASILAGKKKKGTQLARKRAERRQNKAVQKEEKRKNKMTPRPVGKFIVVNKSRPDATCWEEVFTKPSKLRH